ncbi:prolactin-releasing peptide receptor [Parasteatoda tepidariorum]|uniref:prolactin-releasing peptide receptor n=1 Tax=Parasteatoda tepidariorum TaxID=114398 RepID=UPI00077FBFCE|nr:prolactin-releasing peptide receptor-like [Parasteatoda tepidariorum]
MPMREIPDRYLGMIIHFLMNFHNDTSEFRHPHLRKSFQKKTYIFFVFMYGALVVIGFIANIILIRNILIRREYNMSMYKYLAFNAVNDILKCIIVLPLALSTTLFQNWFYGSFLCYLFPMLQDVPFHATMLTLLLITFDRYRQIVYPLKQPIPTFLAMLGVWVVTLFAVLPYAVYTRYLDLEAYFGPQFKGTGICAINLDDNIEEYIRGLFIIMYVLPLVLVAFLHVKSSEEIKARQTAFTVSYHDINTERNNVPSLNPLQTAVPNNNQLNERPLHFETLTSEDGKDWNAEKQMQEFLVTAVILYALCLLPLNMVRLLKHVVYETYETSFQFDCTFITAVWLAFCPTITTPLIFQQKTGIHNSNISRYLRLGGRSSDVSTYEIEQTL